MKTELNDRTLWFDGTSQVNPELVPDLFLAGIPLNCIVTNSLTAEIEQFNQMSDVLLEFEKITNRDFSKRWNIPDNYIQMDLNKEIRQTFINFIAVNNQLNQAVYKERMEAELVEIEKRNMELLIKTLFYVVDEFKKTKTVWGIGRGSSCASFVLFLIGLHKVDPIKYDIPLTEFFH